MRLAALLYLLPLTAYGADATTAFSDGQTLGLSQTTIINNGLVTDQAQNAVPGYTTTAPPASQFGVTSLFGAATGKITGCATEPTNPDPYKQQECDAVNFLAQNPTRRTQFAITKNDPLIVRAKSILANPAAFAGPMGGSYSACSTQNVDQPAQYAAEVCNEYIPLESQVCSIGQNVQVDADANYQCDVTSNAYETQSCGKWVNASVTNSCTSQWVPRTFNPPTGPTGHPLSTYDDLRHGAGAVCSVVWPGSLPVSATCYPPQTCDGDGYCWQVSAHGGCDHLHNGGWFYSSSCYDQQWCNGDGIASITCQKLETVCNPVVTITPVNGCATLEARAQ